MNWPVVQLGSICQTTSGGTPLRSRAEYFGGLIPWVKSGDLTDGDVTSCEENITEIGLHNSSAKLFPKGTVLIAMYGATVGKLGLLGMEAATNQAVCGITAPSELDHKFLFYFLLAQRQKLIDLSTGGAQPNISQRIIRDIFVPVPNIDEQRNIVDILSRAEGIVRLRREAQKKATEIIPALFLDMFGDPATNPKGWATKPFGLVGMLDRGKSRHRPRDAQELYGGPYPFIQTGDVANSGGRIKQYTATYSERGLAQSRLWPSGTLCITIAANIAKTGILEFDSCFPDSVVGFLPGEAVKTEYVQAWLGFLQPMLEANAPQAAQKNINLEVLRGLPVPVPPLALQEAFEQRCMDISAIQKQQAAATAKATTSFDALLAQVLHPTSCNHFSRSADDRTI